MRKCPNRCLLMTGNVYIFVCNHDHPYQNYLKIINQNINSIQVIRLYENNYLVFFDETHERSPLYLDRLAVSIVKSDHKMEEVTFSQIAWWLFLEVSSTDTNPEIHI